LPLKILYLHKLGGAVMVTKILKVYAKENYPS
jgi:hypothetical protein